MKHTVKINVADKNGNGIEVLRTGKLSIPQKILRLIFGDFCEVMLLIPGKTVVGVEICEQKPECPALTRGGDDNE